MMRTVLVFLFVSSYLIANSQNFYDLNVIRDINLKFEDEHWDKKLASLKSIKKKSRLSANVIIDGKTYEQVGVRYKGNSSYNNTRKEEKTKLPLNVEADYKLKKQSFGDGIETLKLSNMFRDPSCIREVLAYWLANQLFATPKANFAKVYINNTYFGLYTSTESIDSRFLKSNFGTKKGILFKCDPEWDVKDAKNCPKGDNASLMWQGTDSTCYAGNYELKSKSGYKELINLIAVLDKHPDKIEKVLDVDKTLWMHAFNHITVNLDSYTGRLSHNYYLYMDSSNLFVPLLWDLNLAFGGFRMDEKKNLTDEELLNYPLLAHSEDPTRPLISKLLKNPLYRKIYLAHCKYIYDNFFANNKLENEARKIVAKIDTEIKNDKNKLYTYDEFKQNIEKSVTVGKTPVIGLIELINARKQYMQNYFRDQEYIRVDSVFQVSDSAGVKICAKTTGCDKTILFYKNQQHPRYISVQMQEDEKLSATMGGKCFVYSIPASEKTYYYVVAESEKVAQVFPAKASNEPLILQKK